MYIFEVVTFFASLMAIQLTQYLMAVHIHVFDEAFSLLTIRMAIKLFGVVTCREELSHIDMHNSLMEWSCEVT